MSDDLLNIVRCSSGKTCKDGDIVIPNEEFVNAFGVDKLGEAL